VQQANWTPASTEQISQRLDGANRADVKLEFSAGTLRLDALSGSDELIAGSVDLARGERAAWNFRPDNGTAYYTLKSETSAGFVPFFMTGNERKSWDLRLNSKVPMQLYVSAGVGEANLDLRNLNLTGLKVEAGAGTVNLSLPTRGTYSAEIEAGVGRVEIEVPKALGVKIEAEPGIGGIDVIGDYTRNGDIYESRNYAAAQNKVSLRVEGGVGQITIRETSND
jgi:hypothetical protein